MIDEFEQGIKHYIDGGSLSSYSGSYTADFINGYTKEERQSKCGYSRRYWNATVNYKRL